MSQLRFDQARDVIRELAESSFQADDDSAVLVAVNAKTIEFVDKTSWYYLEVERVAGTIVAEGLGAALELLASTPGLPTIKMKGAYNAYLDGRGIQLYTAERQALIDAAATALPSTPENAAMIQAIKSLGIRQISVMESRAGRDLLDVGEVQSIRDWETNANYLSQWIAPKADAYSAAHAAFSQQEENYTAAINANNAGASLAELQEILGE